MSLLSPTLCSYVKKSFRFAKRLHPHPFSWNERLSGPEMCTRTGTGRSKSGRFFWLCNAFIVLFHYIFHLVQIIQLRLAGLLSPVKMTYLLLLLVCFTFGLMSQVTNWLMEDQVPGFVCRFFNLMGQFADDLKSLKNSKEEDSNQMRIVAGTGIGIRTGNRAIERKMKKQENNRQTTLMPKKFDSFFIFLYWAGQPVVIMAFLLNMSLPKSSEFISSRILPLVPQDEQDSNSKTGSVFKILRRTVVLLSSLFHAHIWCMLVSNSFLWIMNGFAFIFSATLALHQIKTWLKEQKREGREISREKIQLIVSMYQGLEVLRKSFHFIYCSLFFPLVKAEAIIGVIFSIYGGIKMDGIIRVFLVNLGAGAGSVLIVMVATLAQFHTQSKEIQGLMKSPEFHKNLSAYEKLVVRSLNLIQVKMGSSYVVDKECVITVFRVLLENSINLLLTYK